MIVRLMVKKMTEEYDNITNNDYEVVFDYSIDYKIRLFLGKILEELRSSDEKYFKSGYRYGPYRLTEPGLSYHYIFICDIERDNLSFSFRIKNKRYYEDAVQAIVFSVKTYGQEIFGERICVEILKDW